MVEEANKNLDAKSRLH